MTVQNCPGRLTPMGMGPQWGQERGCCTVSDGQRKAPELPVELWQSPFLCCDGTTRERDAIDQIIDLCRSS